MLFLIINQVQIKILLRIFKFRVSCCRKKTLAISKKMCYNTHIKDFDLIFLEYKLLYFWFYIVYFGGNNMKKIIRLSIFILLISLLFLTSCQAVGPVILTMNNEDASYSVSGIGNPIVVVGTLVLPESHNDVPVTKIPDGGFAGWSGVFDLVIPGTIKSVGDYAFGTCQNLTRVSIGEGTETIGDYAFANCNMLGEVYLPSTIKSIGVAAFGLCVTLQHIQFNGTMEQWNAIEKAEGWDQEAGFGFEYVVRCTDGDVVLGDESGERLPDIEN